MTQYVYGAIGAVIGYYVTGGSYQGALQGFSIGYGIGAIQAAPDMQGPRLQDLSVQISSYGAPVPYTWGSDRIAGNVIWSSGLIETANEESAKGGPTLTTFAYSANCAVLICDGVKKSVRRMWADTKLVYDASEDADTATAAASYDFRQFFTFYEGNETQLPDPTIESFEGVGNVEAFRGSCYIVFHGLPLADYGNRIPSFSFELSDEPEAEGATEVLLPKGVPIWMFVDGKPMAAPLNPEEAGDDVYGAMEFTVYYPTGGPGTTFTSLSAALAQALITAEDRGGTGDTHGNAVADQYLAFYTGTHDTPSVFAGGAASVLDNPEYVYYIYTTLGEGAVDIGETTQASSVTGCGACAAAGLTAYEDSVIFTPGSWSSTNGNGGLMSMQPFRGASFINNCVDDYGTGPPQPKAYRASANVIRGRRLPRCDTQLCYEGAPCGSLGIAQIPDKPQFCITCAGDVSANAEVLETGGTYKQLTIDEWGGVGSGRYLVRPAQGPIVLLGDPLYDDEAFWTQAAADSAYGVPGPYSEDGADGTYPQIVSTVCRAETNQVAVARSTVLLSDIVADLCEDAGMAPDQYDVTQLDDVVLGYTRTKVMAARAAIEPLRSAFWFDPVESGELVRFVKRGGAPVATLVLRDLAAGVDEASGDPVDSTRAQESELPRSMVVTYKALTADYQSGTQQSRRQVGGTQQATGAEIPVVLSDLRAAQIADVLLYQAWVARKRRSFATWRRWSGLEPTDVVLIDDGEFQYRVRLDEGSQDGGVLSFKAVDEEAETYDPDSVAARPSGGGSVVRFEGPTRYELLDIPLLRDADDNAGVYVAASGYRDGWRGGRMYRSTDGGTSYDPFQDLKNTAIIGVANTALGDFGGGNTVDEANSFDVTINAGTLASITQAQLLNNGNAAALGADGRWEILQFKRATLVSGKRWRLSGLLRGRLGTEQHMGSHESDDAFVLLTVSTLYRPDSALGLLYQVLQYKAVSFGSDLSSDLPRDFAIEGVGLMPLSPVHVNVIATGDGNYAAQWVRRSRIAAGWQDSADVPLGETSERYEVDVVRDGDVVDTYVVISPEAEIEAEEGDVVTVYQMSGTVGRGFPSSAIAGANFFLPGPTNPDNNPQTVNALLLCASADGWLAYSTEDVGSDTVATFWKAPDVSGPFMAETTVTTAIASLTSPGVPPVIGRVAQAAGISLQFVFGSAHPYKFARVPLDLATDPELVDSDLPDGEAPVSIAGDGSRFVLLTATEALYESADGETWSLLGTASGDTFPGGISVLQIIGARWFMVFGSGAGVGATNDRLFYTDDADAVTGWTAASAAPPVDSAVKSMHEEIVFDGTLHYAAVSEFTTGLSRIYRSADGGDTWTLEYTTSTSTGLETDTSGTSAAVMFQFQVTGTTPGDKVRAYTLNGVVFEKSVGSSAWAAKASMLVNPNFGVVFDGRMAVTDQSPIPTTTSRQVRYEVDGVFSPCTGF